MKRYLTPILLVLAVMSGLLSSCSTGIEVYHNHQYGYSMTLPAHWSSKEDTNPHGMTFYPSHRQMEIVVIVDSEDALNDLYSEFVAHSGDTNMTPLELVSRGKATEDMELGAKVKYTEWNENALTTFTLIDAKDFTSWVKTYYIVDNNKFYIISFKVLGYSDSEFKEYQDQLNEICKSFHIDDSSVISLPEGKTIFDF